MAQNEASYDPFYSESNMRALEESAKQIEDGHIVTKTLEELEKMENVNYA